MLLFFFLRKFNLKAIAIPGTIRDCKDNNWNILFRDLQIIPGPHVFSSSGSFQTELLF